jgi:hypothetical protein
MLKVWIQDLISLKLKLVKEEMKFEMRLLFGSKKKIDPFTFINTKYLVV